MPNIIVDAVSVEITAASAAALTCADTTGLYVAQRGWAVDSGGINNIEVIITEVVSSTQFNCQKVIDINNSGNADLSAYNGGTFYFEKQLVEVPGGGSDLSSLDTISIGKVPARTSGGFVNANLDNIPDSATRMAVTASEKTVLSATTALNSGEVPAKTAGGSMAAATTANVPASTDKNYVTDNEHSAVAALAAAGTTGTGAFVRESEVVSLPSKGDTVAGAGGGASPGVVAAPADGSILVADSTQTFGWNSSASKAPALTAITIPSRGTSDSNGLGITLTADAAGSGGTGNHDGGDIILLSGAKAGTGRKGVVQVGAYTKAYRFTHGSELCVYGPHAAEGQLSVFSTDAIADGRGGAITFGGAVSTDGADKPYAYVTLMGSKEGAGADYAGYFKVIVTQANSAQTERMRITSTGVVRISTLAGTGSRAVVADANGNLSAP